MNHKMIEAIEYLNLLKGEPLSRIGRGANMLWQGFGKDVKTTNLKGEERTVSEYALHIQCAWRMIHRSEIIIRNGDFYQLTAENDTDDWDTKGGNLFDLKAVELNSLLRQKGFTVQKTIIRNTGDLKICFSNGLQWKCFRMIRFTKNTGGFFLINRNWLIAGI